MGKRSEVTGNPEGEGGSEDGVGDGDVRASGKTAGHVCRVVWKTSPTRRAAQAVATTVGAACGKRERTTMTKLPRKATRNGDIGTRPLLGVGTIGIRTAECLRTNGS